MNKLIGEELKKVQFADLSNYNQETNSYVIPQRKDIKVEIDKCYLVELKPSFFHKEDLYKNWGNTNQPHSKYLKIDVSKIVQKMIKVVAIEYDNEKKLDLSSFWNGWLNLQDINVLKAL